MQPKASETNFYVSIVAEMLANCTLFL